LSCINDLVSTAFLTRNGDIVNSERSVAGWGESGVPKLVSLRKPIETRIGRTIAKGSDRYPPSVRAATPAGAQAASGNMKRSDYMFPILVRFKNQFI
jgi:hypothetical protein